MVCISMNRLGILNYLKGIMDEFAAIECFECINKVSDLQWSFRSQITKFINRFWRASYKNKDREWIKCITSTKVN